MLIEWKRHLLFNLPFIMSNIETLKYLLQSLYVFIKIIHNIDVKDHDLHKTMYLISC